MQHVKSSDLYVRGAVLAGAAMVSITEILGICHELTRGGLIAAWATVLAGAILLWKRRADRNSGGLGVFVVSAPHTLIFDALIFVSIAAILGLIAFTALESPPNSSDAMAYHMPRVIYWAQQRSVSFFPTPYLNQIMLQPFAEYLMLHTYLLSGGDHFVNLVQWFGCLTSIIAVAGIARMFGAGLRGQLLAALFCATLPNGILQASGAKNDYVLAGWLAAAAYFLLLAQSEGEKRDVVFAGLALGLAFGTKATAYLFVPGLIVAIAAPAWIWWKKNTSRALIVIVCALLLNLPQFARNIDLSGSPLGFDSAHADGQFRWRNETPGWRAAVSNLLRNTTEQLGGRSEQWNCNLYDAVVSMHHRLGLDPNDPSTTWRWSQYEPPRNANHETNAPNRWHLALLAICFFILTWRRPRLFLYLCGLIAGFILFCFYLKWQPFQARMFLPLFVLASPTVGVLAERLKPELLQALLCLFLLSDARLHLLENWVRPLRGPRSLLRTARDDNYFSDMNFWNNKASYFEAVDAAARTGCGTIGIDANQLSLEYPFQALLRERNPHVQFVHTGVLNASRKYEKPDPPRICTVLCLDCAGISEKIEQYKPFGPPRQFGKFLLFAP